jgi:UDPglucose 6-dehydrogenase
LALLKTSQDSGAPARIVGTVVDVNDDRKNRMAEKIVQAFGGVGGKTVAVLGLTFKPNTDDMRDAPSLVIVPTLQAAGARIRAYDPEGMHEAKKLLEIELFTDAYEAITGADGVVILTEWNEFRALDLGRLKSLLTRPLMVDLRNIYRPAHMAEAGFTYVSVGRATVGPGG